MRLSELLDRIPDLLWPRRCMFCGGRPEGRGTVCGKCAERLPLIPADNKRIPVEFTAGCACTLRYEGGVRDAVHRYKYDGSWHYFRHFSALMAANVAARGMEFDTVTYVPTTARRKKSRGYNPAELLARGLCRRLEIPPPEKLLRKCRETRQQAGLEAAARRANVLGAYKAIRDTDIAGRRILLIDDVLTTGATLAECARALLMAGAETVLCATLAHSTGKDKNS